MPGTRPEILKHIDPRLKPLLENGSLFENMVLGQLGYEPYSESLIIVSQDEQKSKEWAEYFNQVIIDLYFHDNDPSGIEQMLWSLPQNPEARTGLFLVSDFAADTENDSIQLIDSTSLDNHLKLFKEELDRIAPLFDITESVVRNTLIDFAVKNAGVETDEGYKLTTRMTETTVSNINNEIAIQEKLNGKILSHIIQKNLQCNVPRTTFIQYANKNKINIDDQHQKYRILNTIPQPGLRNALIDHLNKHFDYHPSQENINNLVQTLNAFGGNATAQDYINAITICLAQDGFHDPDFINNHPEIIQENIAIIQSRAKRQQCIDHLYEITEVIPRHILIELALQHKPFMDDLIRKNQGNFLQIAIATINQRLASTRQLDATVLCNIVEDSLQCSFGTNIFHNYLIANKQDPAIIDIQHQEYFAVRSTIATTETEAIENIAAEIHQPEQDTSANEITDFNKIKSEQQLAAITAAETGKIIGEELIILNKLMEKYESWFSNKQETGGSLRKLITNQLLPNLRIEHPLYQPLTNLVNMLSSNSPDKINLALNEVKQLSRPQEKIASKFLHKDKDSPMIFFERAEAYRLDACKQMGIASKNETALDKIRTECLELLDQANITQGVLNRKIHAYSGHLFTSNESLAKYKKDLYDNIVPIKDARKILAETICEIDAYKKIPAAHRKVYVYGDQVAIENNIKTQNDINTKFDAITKVRAIQDIDHIGAVANIKEKPEQTFPLDPSKNQFKFYVSTYQSLDEDAETIQATVITAKGSLNGVYQSQLRGDLKSVNYMPINELTRLARDTIEKHCIDNPDPGARISFTPAMPVRLCFAIEYYRDLMNSNDSPYPKIAWTPPMPPAHLNEQDKKIFVKNQEMERMEIRKKMDEFFSNQEQARGRFTGSKAIITPQKMKESMDKDLDRDVYRPRYN